MTTIPQYVIESLERWQRETEVKAFEAAARAIMEAATRNVPNASGLALPENKQEQTSTQGVETNRDRVLRALRAKPGMRPSEVVKWLKSQGNNFNEQSILTTIKRLQGDVIERHGDGYYIREITEKRA
jgi:hypothetical protein